MKSPMFNRITDLAERNPMAIHEAKEQGRGVVGQFCLYTPSEIAIAAEAIPVSLCGTKNDSIAAAEAFLPRSICPLIKSSFGFAVKDACPYLAASDIVVADTTCDGKKKMYELLEQYKPVYMLQLPQRQDEDGIAWWREQFIRLARHLEQVFHTQITGEKLRDAIRLMNRERRALKAFMDLAKRRPSPITGMEMVELAFKTSFFPDKEKGIAMIEECAEETAALADKGAAGVSPDAPRVIVTGTPVGMGSHKVVQLIQDCGGSVVCLDNCSAYKKTQVMVDEDKEPYAALAERYLAVPCAVMSPNPRRYETLRRLIGEFSADAVVDLTWQGCQTYAIEAFSLKRFIQQECGIPCMNIETDYSQTDIEQLKVRIEAFLEMLR